MIIVETGPDEFLVAGTGLTITPSRDPEASAGIAGIASVEEGSRVQGQWKTARRLNGDQTNQGRDLFLPAHSVAILRVKLYTITGS